VEIGTIVLQVGTIYPFEISIVNVNLYLDEDSRL